MAPKTKYTKDEIVDAAFEIATTDGFDGITARSVAARLGCSVAPIYVNFSTIEELVSAVTERITALSTQLTEQQTGRDLFEKIGKASLAFARKYPVLFREIALKPNPHIASFEPIHEQMVDAFAEDETMRELTREERKRLFLKMQVFQTGLSVMIANNLAPVSLGEKEAEELLIETGEELLEASLRSRGSARDERE